MEFSYHDQLPGGALAYTVDVHSDTAADQSEQLHLALLGARQDGTVVMEGKLALPTDTLAAARQVLYRVISGLEHLLRGYSGGARRASSVAGASNAGEPWTTELKQQLRDAWLSADQAAPAQQIIGELAHTMGRTKYAIRSQLPRVDCDPDVPGRELATNAEPTEEAARSD